jgi:Optic atrophy 3 protein (OPA3)
MSTLAVKMASLVVKQLSKPIANTLAQVMLSNETLRKATIGAARVRTHAIPLSFIDDRQAAEMLHW